MKTAIICGAGIVSGKEIMALELGEGLRAAGRPIVYVTSLWGDGNFVEQLQVLGFPFYRMRLGFISATLRLDCLWMTADQMVRWPKLVWNYRGFLQREQPRDVIHTNWHHLLLLWPYLRPTRDIFWLHDVIPDKPHYARLFRGLAERLRYFVVVSHAVALSLHRISVPTSKIEVIHNGISDPTSPEGTACESESRGEVSVGIVGQIGAWKGHEDLLAAFAKVAPRHPSARLVVFGTGDQLFIQHLKRLAEALGVAHRIAWHGYIANRTQIYRDMDICVVPSRSEESFGLVALEAAFFRLPVVATRNGGLPEIIVDGETGYTVELQSLVQLADRLDRLLGSTELRRRMGAAARRRAVQHFSRDRFVADFVRLLDIGGRSSEGDVCTTLGY